MIESIVIGGIAAYFLIDCFIAYRSTAGTVWQRIVASCKSSLTILWARFTVIVTAAVSGIAQLADVLNAPGVANAITAYLTPKVVAIIMVTTAIITELARRRGLPKTTDND